MPTNAGTGGDGAHAEEEEDERKAIGGGGGSSRKSSSSGYDAFLGMTQVTAADPGRGRGRLGDGDASFDTDDGGAHWDVQHSTHAAGYAHGGGADSEEEGDEEAAEEEDAADDELEYHKYAAVGASAIRDLNRLLALSGSDAQPSSFDAPAGSSDNPEAVLDAAIGQLAVADAGHATSTPPP